MKKNIKSFALTMAGIVTLCAFQAEAATKQCLKGKEPKQQEALDAEVSNIERSREFSHLFLLSKKGDKIAQKKYDEATNLTIKNISTAAKIYDETILPPLNSCSESTMSLDKLKNLLGKWYNLNVSEPLNRDYVYNIKLLTNLISSKEKKYQ